MKTMTMVMLATEVVRKDDDDVDDDKTVVKGNCCWQLTEQRQLEEKILILN